MYDISIVSVNRYPRIVAEHSRYVYRHYYLLQKMYDILIIYIKSIYDINVVNNF